MTYAEIIRLYEKKDHLIKRTHMTDEQKAEVIEFFNKHREQERNISEKEWNKPETLTYERFKQIMDAFNTRQTRSKANKISNKLGISGIIEGVDYADLGEHDSPVLGKYHAYVPLSWLGTKTIAGSKVLPNYKNYTSAQWCIGESDTDKYFHRYFVEHYSNFLILCGEKIPTKKVCIQICVDYGKIDSGNLNTWQMGNYCCWDYNDRNSYDGDTQYKLDYLIKGNSAEEEKEKKVILDLMNQAIEISNKRRIQYFEEFKEDKPLIILKSVYLDKLESFRKSNSQNGFFGYKDCLNKGKEFLSFMDRIYLQVKKINPTFKLSLYSFDSSKKWEGNYLSWYEENRNKTLSKVNFYPFFLVRLVPNCPASDKFILNTFSFKLNANIPVKVKTEISFLNFLTPRYSTLCELKSFLSQDRNPYFYGRKRKVISEFNNMELLTVEDIVALLGDSILNSNYSKRTSKYERVKITIVPSVAILPIRIKDILNRLDNSKNQDKEVITLCKKLPKEKDNWDSDYFVVNNKGFEIQKGYYNPIDFMESKDFEIMFSLINFIIQQLKEN